MALVEFEPQAASLTQELLDMSTYVLSTCVWRPTNGFNGLNVAWKGHHNPVLSVAASLLHRPTRATVVDVHTAIMRVEDSDLGLELRVSRDFVGTPLPDDDFTGLYVLNNFRQFYQKC